MTLGKGASIIEKHYTDKYSRKGVDIMTSIDFKKLKDLIIASKELFKAIPGNKIHSKRRKKYYEICICLCRCYKKY